MLATVLFSAHGKIMITGKGYWFYSQIFNPTLFSEDFFRHAGDCRKLDSYIGDFGAKLRFALQQTWQYLKWKEMHFEKIHFEKNLTNKELF